MIDKKNILGVGITNATRREVLEYIIKNVENVKKKFFIVTPNPEFLVLAHKNSLFKNILNNADLASADGIGVMIAAKILGKPLKERFAGVDLVKSLCKEASEKPITVGFLGGGAGVAEKTAECLRKKHPKLKVVFAQEEWPNEYFGRLSHVADDARTVNLSTMSNSSSLSERLLQSKRKSAFSSSASGQAPSLQLPENGLPRILQSKSAIHHSSFIIHHSVDILFVAFGAPKQEFWINENLQNLPVKVAIGVGGAFDYISGKVPRAPVWMQNIGLEWLFRLIVQPWRIKRQFALVEFVWLVLKEKIRQGNEDGR